MGVFPFAATTRGTTGSGCLWSGGLWSSGWYGRRLHRPASDAIARARQICRHVIAYIQHVPLLRTPVRSPFAGGFWLAPAIERGPPSGPA